jgi:hypothetical protein
MTSSVQLPVILVKELQHCRINNSAEVFQSVFRNGLLSFFIQRRFDLSSLLIYFHWGFEILGQC